MHEQTALAFNSLNWLQKGSPTAVAPERVTE